MAVTPGYLQVRPRARTSTHPSGPPRYLSRTVTGFLRFQGSKDASGAVTWPCGRCPILDPFGA